jgi:O-antigen/teichoic acid export membrane protein
VYHLALTLTTIAAVIGRAGLDNTLLRRASAAQASKDSALLAGIFKTGMSLALMLGVITATVFVLSVPPLTSWLLPTREFESTLIVMSVAIAPLALSSLCGEFFKAVGRVQLASFLQGAALPLLNLVAIVCFFSYLTSPTHGAAIYVASAGIVFVVCAWIWFRHLPYSGSGSRVRVTRVGLLQEAKPMYLAALAALATNSADTIILGAFGDAREVGIYSAGWRVSILFGLVSLGVNGVVAPRFAAYQSARNTEALKALSISSCALCAAAGFVPAVICIVIPNVILRPFGNEFVEGAEVLRILALGRFASLITAPIGHFLQVGGRAEIERNIALLGAGLLLLLGLAFTYLWGAIGTAWAALLALSVSATARGCVAYMSLWGRGRG